MGLPCLTAFWRSQDQDSTARRTMIEHLPPSTLRHVGRHRYSVRTRPAKCASRHSPNELFLNNLRRIGNHLVGGWGVASIFDTQTGIPFSLTTGADSNHDGDAGDRVVVV